MAEKNFYGLLGIVLMIAGIALFIIFVPKVSAADLGFKEYLWAMVVVCSTAMGFGLIMMCLMEDEKPDAKS